MSKFALLALYTVLGMATIYAASELISWLAQLHPETTEQIRHYCWLVVVLVVGVVFLRPMFLLYKDDD